MHKIENSVNNNRKLFSNSISGVIQTQRKLRQNSQHTLGPARPCCAYARTVRCGWQANSSTDDHSCMCLCIYIACQFLCRKAQKRDKHFIFFLNISRFCLLGFYFCYTLLMQSILVLSKRLQQFEIFSCDNGFLS